MNAAAHVEQALDLAVANVAEGGGPFGALVVRDGAVVGSGGNSVTRGLDPTAHAEVLAIRDACRALDTFSLQGCVLVSSCEPCPMCLAASLWARVDGVLYAADRHDAAEAGFDDLTFHELLHPASEWPVPLRRLDSPQRNAPFEAWRDHHDRVEY
ncbi:nucleoside deaminase [Allosaccharopolyspora coralli]|uniref:Nucleoside deaminase n=1 Tax=Allosaccharopolyspora coralli TaxID=2665642 RepID=A0A5Q3QC85_9PSEU|nr:nucleoside deaminase [Allosaccharopolyspora coralli]QGK72072.1 nucleoside deaminase [Allosaccharopolyspora coralli]